MRIHTQHAHTHTCTHKHLHIQAQLVHTHAHTRMHGTHALMYIALQESRYDENLMTPELKELVEVLQTKGSNVKADELQVLRKKVCTCGRVGGGGRGLYVCVCVRACVYLCVCLCA